jgi:hypothetical protein
MILSKAVSIWRHDDFTHSDDEEKEHDDDFISDSGEEEDAALSSPGTFAVDDDNNTNASGNGNENDFDHGVEEDIWVDDDDEYFIGDVPALPRYQCHRKWRSYYVPEDEE